MTLKTEDVAYRRKNGGRETNVSKAAAEKERAAQIKWRAEKTAALNIRLSVDNDADIIEKLASVSSKTEYVKRLIREDINKAGAVD